MSVNLLVMINRKLADRTESIISLLSIKSLYRSSCEDTTSIQSRLERGENVTDLNSVDIDGHFTKVMISRKYRSSREFEHQMI